ncbi:MAG: outer membrane lipoprotein-sorting protein [Gemmatimonadetes bacterium]|nr:outer membrane lipoprotein-sorting protein [Gemmatimonadota bacterium]NIO31401.1 outer membrane lipoprotein-sorting protein [Gemmatimonadota bacterium]
MNRTRTLALTLTLFSAPTLALGQESARDIIDRVDRIMRGESSYGVATMDVVTENWERSMTMEVWSLGTEYSLIRITAPNKEAGTATLKAGDDIWNYLPRVDRSIKIPASLMMGAWMGSHFTNDDLVKESRLVEDYDIEIQFEGARDGAEVWEFVLTPKPEAAVVWGRITYEVRKDDLMPVWARYYDEDGTLVRTMTFGDYRMMGGRLVPAAMDMIPEDKPGERTSVRYSEIEFDIDIDESFFSLRALRSRR